MNFKSCEICKELKENDDLKICLVCGKSFCRNCYFDNNQFCSFCNSEIL